MRALIDKWFDQGVTKSIEINCLSTLIQKPSAPFLKMHFLRQNASSPIRISKLRKLWHPTVILYHSKVARELYNFLEAFISMTFGFLIILHHQVAALANWSSGSIRTCKVATEMMDAVFSCVLWSPDHVSKFHWIYVSEWKFDLSCNAWVEHCNWLFDEIICLVWASNTWRERNGLLSLSRHNRAPHNIQICSWWQCLPPFQQLH